MLDGFYVGYMTSNGYGVALFVFKDKNLVGADAGGVKFDGTFDQDPVTKSYRGKVVVNAPPNIDVVQGINTGPNGLVYEVPFSMPENFLDAPFIKVDTPFGPVNIKLEKLRDLGNIS